MQARISSVLNTSVRVTGKEDKGKISLSYNSKEELEELLSRLASPALEGRTQPVLAGSDKPVLEGRNRPSLDGAALDALDAAKRLSLAGADGNPALAGSDNAALPASGNAALSASTHAALGAKNLQVLEGGGKAALNAESPSDASGIENTGFFK